MQRLSGTKIRKKFNICNTSKGVKFKKQRKMKKSNENSYTTKFINQNFRIKVYGRDEQGKRINSLYGVSGVIAMIGEELFFKFIRRALECMKDVCVCKLRRGLVISLYVK